MSEPQVAYGPPGTSGEENVSIIAAPIQSPFRHSTQPSSLFSTAKQCPRRRDAFTEGIVMHCDGACFSVLCDTAALEPVLGDSASCLRQLHSGTWSRDASAAWKA